MKSHKELEDLALRVHWSVQNDHLGEAVKILDALQTEKKDVPDPVEYKEFRPYLPGHATGAVDI